MAKAVALAALPILVGALTIGCSSSSDKPAVCSSLDDLKTSVSQVTDVQSGENSLSALRSNLTAVQTNLNNVMEDAKSQYSAQVSQIRSDLDSLQTAIDAAQQSRSATDISNAVTAAKTLGGSVKKLADDARSTC